MRLYQGNNWEFFVEEGYKILEKKCFVYGSLTIRVMQWRMYTLGKIMGKFCIFPNIFPFFFSKMGE